jgi:hypothetical protein
MVDVARLAMWSGPRNISTALMRAWENRSDSVVVDEPLYAHYLATTGLDHPGREEIIATGETDWRVAVEGLVGPTAPGVRVSYQKQMAHHLTVEIDHAWIARLTNVLLIRDPREVVASYLTSRDQVAPDDIGIPQQLSLYQELAATGSPPRVIAAADFLLAPRSYLEGLCDAVGLPFEEGMLAWPEGPRDTDGVWAPYWYDAVRRSTGFAAYHPRETHLEGVAAHVAAACMPAYETLHAERWLA